MAAVLAGVELVSPDSARPKLWSVEIVAVRSATGLQLRVKKLISMQNSHRPNGPYSEERV